MRCLQIDALTKHVVIIEVAIKSELYSGGDGGDCKIDAHWDLLGYVSTQHLLPTKLTTPWSLIRTYPSLQS